MARIVVLSLALVAAGGGTLVVGVTHLQHQPPDKSSVVIATSAIAPSSSATAPSSSGVQDLSAPTVQVENTNLMAALAVSSSSPNAGEGPIFDIARIEPSGDAVFAGRAAPGASVELLRAGELHDRVVADQSGQFVMVPPRLPPGDYELTLRSSEPGGKQTASKQSVSVALKPSFKERPVVALTTPDRAGITLSRPPGLADGRGSRGGSFHGRGGFHRGVRSNVAAGGFRGAYRGYGNGYRYGGFPYDEYGYGCWGPGPYGRPIYVCY
jgi:hypothetical protein